MIYDEKWKAKLFVLTNGTAAARLIFGESTVCIPDFEESNPMGESDERSNSFNYG